MVCRIVHTRVAGSVLVGGMLVIMACPSGADAQDRLKALPGADGVQRVIRALPTAVKSGQVVVTWAPDARTAEFTRDGRLFRVDVTSRQVLDIGPAASAQASPARPVGGPARGRQADTSTSPDGTRTATYRARNLYVSAVDGTGETAITTDGSERDRLKYGTASWVYGEELYQTTAMWWSPDSTKLAYYRFDEKQVPDYFLQLDQTKLYSKVDTEAYPKAGEPNPVVDLFVYDVATRTSVRLDVRSGKPFEADALGYYVYNVRWSPDGRELLFLRTNRRQNTMEFVAANPATGTCRVILREEWLTGWVDETPTVHFLKDGRRFIWSSERNGFANYYLYDLSGTLITPLTRYTTFEAGAIVKIDETANVLFVMALDGSNHLKPQLHRVSLDGKADRRLTDPAFHHTVGSCLARGGGAAGGPGFASQPCGISPDNRYLIDVYQTHEAPAATRVLDANTGGVVVELAAPDMSGFKALGLRTSELFTFRAADGQTTLRGLITFPSTFDPARRYPILMPVYGGPASAGNTARETFVQPNPLAEYGFIVVNLDTRAAPGQGKRTLDTIYMKLGQTEIDDMAAGIRALAGRSYVDAARVGVYGTSYGGYASLMCLLRYPDVFRVASASSPVTAWNHYDTIYTERYMRTPAENPDGYRLGSAMTYADALDGRLLIYYGTEDNNVHPANSLQLIQALQRAGKSFEVQVGPDLGHTAVNQGRMMEFFIENLITTPVPAAVPVAKK